MPSQNLPASCSAPLFSPWCWHTFRFCWVAISCLERSTRILAPASVIGGRIAEVTDLLQLHLWRWEPRGGVPSPCGPLILQEGGCSRLVLKPAWSDPVVSASVGEGNPGCRYVARLCGCVDATFHCKQVPWPYPGRRLIRRFQRSWGLITDWRQDMHRGRENLWPGSPSIS